MSLLLMATTTGAPSVVSGPPVPLDLTNAIIACHGNSLTLGTGVSAQDSYPSKLAAMLAGTGATVYNFGTGGIPTTTMTTEAPTVVDPYYSPLVTSLLIGNDWLNAISLFNKTALQHYQDVLIYYNARKAVGWRTLLMTNHAARRTPPETVSPYTGQTYGEIWAKVVAVNELMVSSGDIPITDLIRLDEIPELQDEKDPEFFSSDETHLMPPGYNLRAVAVYNKITSLAA